MDNSRTIPADFSLGATIRSARIKACLTQADIAYRLSVSKPSVWAWEKNRALPTVEKIELLAEVLGLPEEELSRGRFRGYQAVVGRCRNEIAMVLGVSPDTVKISLEL